MLQVTSCLDKSRYEIIFTPSRVLQLVYNFLSIYENWRFINAYHYALFLTISIQLKYLSSFPSIHFNIILPQPYQSSKWPYSKRFPTKIQCAISVSFDRISSQSRIQCVHWQSWTLTVASRLPPSTTRFSRYEWSIAPWRNKINFVGGRTIVDFKWLTVKSLAKS